MVRLLGDNQGNRAGQWALVAVLASALAVVGCGSDNDSNGAPDAGGGTPDTGGGAPDTGGGTPDTGGGTAKLSLSFSGLAPLQGGVHYEGWAMIDGAPVATGKFNIDDKGELVDLDGGVIAGGSFEVKGADLSKATKIIISIEPKDDSDPAPAATKYLAGDVSAGSAALDVATAPALGDDFTTAEGGYILATPTDGSGNNELSGVWFLNPGLTLPTLPAGWAYEGWVVIDGTPVTTGRFTDPKAKDDAAPYSGDQGSPDVPGEDLLKNPPAGLTFPLDLSGKTIVVSVEPQPDDSPAPFALKPLVGMVPADAKDHTSYPLDNKAAAFPTGTAKIE